MRKIVFTFFILLPSFCFAQSTFTGFVREQNTGTKLAEVIVKSSGANSIASDINGFFILKFQGFKPGTSIIVRVEKDGFEIVNEKEMATFIPENPDSKPFKIILCKAGTLAMARSRYYETFELNLQAQLDKQKALNKGNEKKIASLEQDFTMLQKQLNDLADEYSRIDLTDASDKDLIAIELFKEGKYDEFIKLKNNIVTEAQVDKAIKSKAEATKTIANNDSTINLYLASQKDIAKALLLQFKFEEAERIFENIILKDTTAFDNIFDFARFLQQQNKHDKAIRNYEKALTLAETEDEITATQNNLGGLYVDINDYQAALDAFGKALEINERLAKTNPGKYEPEVATTQNNLGLFYKNINDLPAALNAYGKALEIYERLAKTNPATYEPDLAGIQNNLAVYYMDVYDYPAALNAYDKALEIRERLAKTNPAAYEPYVAMIQSNLGILYEYKNDYPAALNAYGKALEIRERLAKTNPAMNEPEVALIQNNLGGLYIAINDYPAALNAYGKSLEIRERLAKSNPATYEPFVAGIQNNLGLLYQGNNDFPAALNAYGKALEIYERLAKTNPASYEPFVAGTQNNLGILFENKNDYPAAFSAYDKALEIYDRLAKTDPDLYEIELCRSIVLLGLLQKEDYHANRQKEIDQYLGKASKILPKYPEVPLAKKLLEAVNYLENYFKSKN